MKPNSNNCSDIKCLRFFTKEICPYYCHFLHTKKDSGGPSIHRIDESFPLKPSLVIPLFYATLFEGFLHQKHLKVSKYLLFLSKK